MRTSRYPDRVTKAQAETQLLQLLCGCTDAALAGFTPDILVSRYRVDRKVAEYRLTMERQRRAKAA